MSSWLSMSERSGGGVLGAATSGVLTSKPEAGETGVASGGGWHGRYYTCRVGLSSAVFGLLACFSAGLQMILLTSCIANGRMSSLRSKL